MEHQHGRGRDLVTFELPNLAEANFLSPQLMHRFSQTFGRAALKERVIRPKLGMLIHVLMNLNYPEL
jgi:hypothetical protein